MFASLGVASVVWAADEGTPLPAVPDGARMAFEEDWSSGKIDPAKWYVLRKKWGGGNFGVVPENVSIKPDEVNGVTKNVVVCEAHGDKYDGPVVGMWGKRPRVGGVIVTKRFFASGRYEVVMKIGDATAHDGGPADPTKPKGTVPAIWTFAYRFVQTSKENMHRFVPETPMYNPQMPAYGGPFNEYWTELDFPEFGKNGDFSQAMYNTFCQNHHVPKMFPIGFVADGKYHTFTTEWRTELKPLPGVRDDQVVEGEGYWWVQDKSIKFDDYLGNPLKRLGKDNYAVYWGKSSTHWIDGKKVAEANQWVPSMAAQLNIGIWLPDWAGPAPWKTSKVSFASVKIWQYDDEGDARGIITEDLADSFDVKGNEIR
ncbi:MAG: hypothetical protein GC159_03000 [Phycisphaera sp.]|nr:hypothetical protein [Phycisphaera sp.]